LELEGFDVRTFSRGAELLRAHDIAACQRFVVDQKMPGVTGLELIGRLRDRNIATPAIHYQPSEQDTKHSGCKCRVPIVEKPLLGDTLLEVFAQLWHASSSGSILAGQFVKFAGG
jgi:FixJ family two-component response regulator